jgi:hypothetical protein
MVNNHGDYEVTVYHTFHDEVDSYRTHVWQCNGPCKTQPPYFGLVKRSMNRAPGKGDTWWARHEAECGGTYTKIQEPAMTKKQIDAMSAKERAGRQKNKLDSWVKAGARIDRPEDDTSDQPIDIDSVNKTSTPTNKRKASTLVVDDIVQVGQKRARIDRSDNNLNAESKILVQCPICSQKIVESGINEHLDVVHLS